MESRTQRVVLETERHRVVGDLNMPREGYRSRISDFLNQGDMDFVPLTNATVFELHDSGASEATSHEFVAVGAAHVQLAYPDPE